MKASRSHPLIRKALKATFPEYRGRTIEVEPWTHPVWVQWNWDGGSRDYVRFLLPDGQVGVPNVPAPWSHDWPRLNPADWPAGTVAAVRHVFCGKETGVTFYVSPDSPMLTEGGAR